MEFKLQLALGTNSAKSKLKLELHTKVPPEGGETASNLLRTTASEQTESVGREGCPDRAVSRLELAPRAIRISTHFRRARLEICFIEQIECFHALILVGASLSKAGTLCEAQVGLAEARSAHEVATCIAEQAHRRLGWRPRDVQVIVRVNPGTSQGLSGQVRPRRRLPPTLKPATAPYVRLTGSPLLAC